MEYMDDRRHAPRTTVVAHDTSLENFKRLVAEGKRRHFAQFIEITPSIANYMLQKNPDNRDDKSFLVTRIANTIENDTFECNGESVVISSCGHLNDGQHRLMAVVRTGKSIKTLVAFGLPRATRESIDSTQSSRSAADYLKMQGVSNPGDVSRIASVLRLVDVQGSYVGSMIQLSTETAAYGLEHLEEIEAATKVVTKAGGRSLLNYQSICALYVLFSRAAGEDLARQFIMRLQSGAGLAATSPIYVLRERLLRAKISARSTGFGKHYINEMMELIIRGWNHWRAGTSASRMLVMGTWPEISR